MTYVEPFCVHLQRLMEEHGMTQAQLARRMGVGRRCVHAWYWGINTPKLETLRKLRRVFQCSWEELLGE